jgi:hypothetical protein
MIKLMPNAGQRQFRFREEVQLKLSPSLKKILTPAYDPCPEFSPGSACHGEMRWEPSAGHVPRAFLGAYGELSEVELVLVFSEPGDPYDNDGYEEECLRNTVLDKVYEDTADIVRTGHDLFHRNLLYILDLCWPNTSFDHKLRKVWLTESVLCSAPKEGGPVSKQSCIACGKRYLLPQLELFQHALVVAVGAKPRDRLRLLELREGADFIAVRSISPPGANMRGARESWEQIPNELRRHPGSKR